MSITKETKKDLITKYARIDGDTGSPEVQIAILTERIVNLTEHFKTHKKDNHLCIFDELFSGTNPSDAVETANGFMKFINKYHNVRFLITTHYFDLCNNDNKLNIINKCMKTTDNNGIIQYSYKFVSGVSKIKAGKDVLRQMDYPDEIFN